MVVKKIGVLSLGKIMGAMYGALGLLFGCIFALLSLLGMGAAMAQEGAPAGVAGLVFGVGAVLFMPLVYGFFGFVGGVLSAFIFNLFSGLTGGLELEVE